MSEKAAKTKKKGADVERFEVDLWVTDWNPTEVGIYQNARHRAKSRQFTRDMDIFAAVSRNGERTGLLAYRKGLWKDNEGMNKRLVIKLFSAEMNWRGTLDLLLARSLQLTHGANGFPVTAFSLNLANHDQIIQVERSAFKWPGMPEKFSFFLLRDGKPSFYRLRRNWVSVGDDYTLYDEHDKRIGKLNGKILNLGGKWKVWVEKAHGDALMQMALQLFCGMLKFNDECRHHLEDLVDDLYRGQEISKLGAHEADLYMNPRRVR